MNNILQRISNGKHLTHQESYELVGSMMHGELSQVMIGSILVGLRMKGETSDEIAGFIHAIRDHMITISAPGAIDVCGTGGDSKGTFNISTAVAFTVAGTGVQVAKHGNRAASSKCGSADVLEALGVKINLKPRYTQAVLQKTSLVFLFAPVYHPSYRYIADVRKQLSIPTIFNFIGPFTNPAQVTKQIVGVPDRHIAAKLAIVSQKLRYKHLGIITSEDGLDEISLNAKTYLYEIKGEKIKNAVIKPSLYGFKKCHQTQIAGGSVLENAHILIDILTGKKGPRRDIVILNSAAALYISDTVDNLSEGILLAEKSLDSGNAKRVLDRLISVSNDTQYA